MLFKYFTYGGCNEACSVAQIACHALEAEVFENEPMSRHTTFKIGGPADIFIIPRDEEVCFCSLHFLQRFRHSSFCCGQRQ